MSVSAFYEIVEWLLAVVVSPETAEHYNGQQGDVFDAQKDMLCALGGALGAALCLWIAGRRDSTGRSFSRERVP